MLLPLKVESSSFGIEALMAAYGGVPILVSSNSGLAFLMESLGEGEAIVYRTTGSLRKDATTWSEQIIQKIRDPEQAQKLAKSLRGTFLLDTNISASHIEFVKIITGTFKSSFVMVCVINRVHSKIFCARSAIFVKDPFEAFVGEIIGCTVLN